MKSRLIRDIKEETLDPLRNLARRNHLAAAMKTHGIDILLTDNKSDVLCFDDFESYTLKDVEVFLNQLLRKTEMNFAGKALPMDYHFSDTITASLSLAPL